MSRNKPPLLQSAFRPDAVNENPQKGNLRVLDQALNKVWALGQNMVLCWAATADGVELLVVAHDFLAGFADSTRSDQSESGLPESNDNLIRHLISGSRQLNSLEFNTVAAQLGLVRTHIKLPITLTLDAQTCVLVDGLVKRYSISFVASRAVILFDIVDFSRFSSFQQTSQLSNLAYTLNSAWAMLKQINGQIEISRTTTGDGFYVWNASTGQESAEDLFRFMMLVIAQNAALLRDAKAGTVPILRSAFHVGSHYEFYHAQAQNSSSASYIVGDVTIELARMLELARPGQIFIGDFDVDILTSMRDEAYVIPVDSCGFIERCNKSLSLFNQQEIAGYRLQSLHCFLSGESGVSGGQVLRRFKITDKHGFSRCAYNLRCNVRLVHEPPLIVGLQDSQLPRGSRSKRSMLDRSYSVTTINKKSQQPQT